MSGACLALLLWEKAKQQQILSIFFFFSFQQHYCFFVFLLHNVQCGVQEVCWQSLGELQNGGAGFYGWIFFCVFWWNLLIHRQIFQWVFLTQLIARQGFSALSGNVLFPEASLSPHGCSICIYEMLNQTLGNFSCAVSWFLFFSGLLSVVLYSPDAFSAYKGKLPLSIRACLLPKLSNISREPWNLLLMLLTKWIFHTKMNTGSESKRLCSTKL